MSIKSFLVDGVPTVDPQTVLEAKGVALIDVRRDEEYIGELGHIEGAKLVTLGPDLDKFMATFDKTQTIIFICRSGARSAKATMTAQEIGIKNSYNMEGGMMAWNSAKLPIVKSSDHKLVTP